MGKPDVVIYNPARHAHPNNNAAYPGFAIVSTAVPLVSITYDQSGDKAATGLTRSPASCPRFTSLNAEPEQPPIKGYSERQRLVVRCPSLELITGTAKRQGEVAHVCGQKAAKLALAPREIQPYLLAGKGNHDAIHCPFVKLPATVIRSLLSVNVSIDCI